MICPICHQNIKGRPALSRKDNKTQICSLCGTKESLEYIPSSMISEEEKQRIIETARKYLEDN